MIMVYNKFIYFKYVVIIVKNEHEISTNKIDTNVPTNKVEYRYQNILEPILCKMKSTLS